jgi:crotonobetainyl-CoA:carnitine CoA-transferase CaiB-like acyl-CoA transferase
MDDYLYEFDDDAIEAYADAEAVIVARLCETIGIMAAPDDTADDEPKPGKAARDRLVALVEEELAEIAAETAANGNRPEAEIRGPVSAQGPPG